MERFDIGSGFSVLDGVALVMGSAIASIHTLRVMRGDLTGAGWVMLWLTFAPGGDHVERAVRLPGAAVRPAPLRLSQDRRSALGDARGSRGC